MHMLIKETSNATFDEVQTFLEQFQFIFSGLKSNMHQHMIFSDDSKLPILGSYTLAQKVSRASRVVTTSLGTSSPENQQQVHVGFFVCLKY